MIVTSSNKFSEPHNFVYTPKDAFVPGSLSMASTLASLQHAHSNNLQGTVTHIYTLNIFSMWKTSTHTHKHIQKHTDKKETNFKWCPIAIYMKKKSLHGLNTKDWVQFYTTQKKHRAKIGKYQRKSIFTYVFLIINDCCAVISMILIEEIGVAAIYSVLSNGYVWILAHRTQTIQIWCWLTLMCPINHYKLRKRWENKNYLPLQMQTIAIHFYQRHLCPTMCSRTMYDANVPENV